MSVIYTDRDDYWMVSYEIRFTDPAAFLAAQASHFGGFSGSPVSAEATFGLPGLSTLEGHLGTGPMAYVTDEGFTFSVLNSMGPGDGYDPRIFHNQVSIDQFRNLDTPPVFSYWRNTGTVSRPTADYWHVHPIWYGYFAFDSYSGAPIVGSPPNLTARFWMDGFEVPVANAAIVGMSSLLSRSASRTPEGLGLSCVQSSLNSISHSLNPVTPLSSPNASWERFYIRPKVYPSSSPVGIWYCGTNLEGGRSAYLHLTPTGALTARNVGNGTYPGTLLGTSATTLALNTWYKIDLFVTYASNTPTPSTPGRMVLFINGAQALDVTVAAGGTGLGATGGLHLNSTLGTVDNSAIAPGGVSTGYDIDFDDWICTSLPPIDINTAKTSVIGADFRRGTHIRVFRPTSTNAHYTGWTGDFRTLGAYPIGQFPDSTVALASAGVGSVLGVTFDYLDVGIGGPVTILLTVYYTTGPATTATFTYTPGVGGGGSTVTPINGAINTFFPQLFQVAAGVATPPAINTLNADFTRGGTGAMNLELMLAAIEFLGVWGPEDLMPGDTNTPLAHTGTHNAPWPEHVSARNLASAQSAFVLTGTYVGNGTAQDINVGQPFHWLWVRGLTGTSGHVFWSSMQAPHAFNSTLITPIHASSFFPSDGTNASFRVVGNNAASNQNGVTYRWVAFADPQARFCLNGNFTWPFAKTTVDNPLIDPTFTPQLAHFSIENFSNTTPALTVRGPGHTADRGSPFNGADSASIATFGTGVITSKANLHASNPQTAYAAWRTTDAGGQSGLVGITTYTGDGVSSRNVPVALGGATPLFSIVTPHNGTTIFRDPSHAGADSSQMGPTVTTGIISHSVNDTVVVGSLLNASGIVYEVFALSSIGLLPPALTASCPPLTSGVINFPFSTVLTLNGGFRPYAITLTAGAMPPGLTLDSGSGAISGTPTAVGTYPFTALVADNSGLSVTVSCSLTITLAGGPGGPLLLTCPPSTAAVASFYNNLVPASGGTPPYTFALTAGPLPPGLALNTATGRISGTPTAAGTYPYTVSVTDSATPTPVTVSASCSLIVASIVVSIPPLGACLACTTLTDAIALLALRLQDVNLVHWTGAELTRYLIEAVRTFQALTSSTLDQGSFFTATGVPFYDIPTVLPALRAYTLRDRDLILDIEYALMEPPTPTVWTGTPQFILNDLVVALEHRRDRFLYETGMIVNRFTMLVLSAPASGRITFDPSIMTIRRVAYQNTLTGATYPLSRDDEWSLQSFLRTWPAQTALPAVRDPQVYSVGVTPPLTLQVAPPLSDPGVLDLLVIQRTGVGGQTTPCLDPNNGSGIFLGVPDDWAWVVKFGALAELLNQQGVTYDPQRAGYCESRWRHGLSLARTASTVLTARINGQPISLDSVPNFDNYRRSWQRTSGVPAAGALAGNNLVALTPVPTGAGHTVTLDLVRNVPVPAVGADCLGAEGEALDAILDYAQHLALFKEGPEQLRGSMDLLDRFFRFAGVTTGIGWASSINYPALANQTRSDERFLPRQIAPPDDTGGTTGGTTGGPA